MIPLPLPIEAFAQPAPAEEAKRALGLPESCAVVLWLGRLSLLTKLDPWPTYQILERVAQRLERPLVLVECGPMITLTGRALERSSQALPVCSVRQAGWGTAGVGRDQASGSGCC